MQGNEFSDEMIEKNYILGLIFVGITWIFVQLLTELAGYQTMLHINEEVEHFRKPLRNF